MLKRWKELFQNHAPKLGALEILKFIGPGFLVTVGFIDPGNWASNMAAGSTYGYKLLWMVTLSTIMLIILQHNAAHLGIVTGLCISEAATKFFRRWVSKFILITAVLASISTALAEILGSAIGLNMLFKIPLPIGAIITSVLVCYMLLSNGYRKIENWIIGFVSLIGVSFIIEICLCKIDWLVSLKSWVVPAIPMGSLPIVMSVLGAVVMPHNLFLHSEIIQSRQWNLESDEIINKQLKYEFLDTVIAMITGWAINSSMILVAAAVFFTNGKVITELSQAEVTLRPLLGNAAAIIFALALLLAGFSSTITAAIAGASIFAGIYEEPFDMSDNHSRTGILITIVGALGIIFFLKNPFQGLIWSQIILSIQLPWTIFTLIFLTSSSKVMGKYANTPVEKVLLWIIGIIVAVLNVALLWELLKS